MQQHQQQQYAAMQNDALTGDPSLCQSLFIMLVFDE